MTVSLTLALITALFPTLVVGDFDIHYWLADLITRHNSSELNASFPYFLMAAEHGYKPLNTTGVHTRFPLQGSSRASDLDLAFASNALMALFQE